MKFGWTKQHQYQMVEKIARLQAACNLKDVIEAKRLFIGVASDILRFASGYLALGNTKSYMIALNKLIGYTTDMLKMFPDFFNEDIVEVEDEF